MDGSPPAHFDPYPYRQHMWLYVRAKRTATPQFSVLMQWFEKSFGKGIAMKARPLVDEMAMHRRAITEASSLSISDVKDHMRGIHNTIHTTLVYFVRYANALTQFLEKTSGTASQHGIDELNFIWHNWCVTDSSGALSAELAAAAASEEHEQQYDEDAYTGITHTKSMRLEIACVIFNAAALCSMVACALPPHLEGKSGCEVLEPHSPSGSVVSVVAVPQAPPMNEVAREYRETEECLTHRCGWFHRSAMFFKHLSALLMQWDIRWEDINSKACEALMHLMRAQAQECRYQDFKQKTKDPFNQLTSAFQGHAASRYYLDFIACYEGIPEDDRDLCIPMHHYAHAIAVRAMIRSSIISHWIERNFKSGGLYGVFVGNAKRCSVILEQAIEELRGAYSDCLSDASQALVAVLKRGSSLCTQRYSVLMTENMDVHKCLVPGDDDIEKSVTLEPEDLVPINVEPNSVTTPSLKLLLAPPKSEFSFVLSGSSERAWSKFRMTLVSEMLHFFQTYNEFHERAITYVSANKTASVMYLVAHSMGASGQARKPSEVPMFSKLASYRDSRSWAEIVAIGGVTSLLERCRGAAERMSDAELSLRREQASGCERLNDVTKSLKMLCDLFTNPNTLRRYIEQWEKEANTFKITMISPPQVSRNASDSEVLDSIVGELRHTLSDPVRNGVKLPPAFEDPNQPDEVYNPAAHPDPSPPTAAAQPSGGMRAALWAMVAGSLAPGITLFSKLKRGTPFLVECARIVRLYDDVIIKMEEYQTNAAEILLEYLPQMDKEVPHAEVCESTLDSWVAKKLQQIRELQQKCFGLKGELLKMLKQIDTERGMTEDNFYEVIAAMGYPVIKDEERSKERTELQNRLSNAVGGMLTVGAALRSARTIEPFTRVLIAEAEKYTVQCDDMRKIISMARGVAAQHDAQRTAPTAASSGRNSTSVRQLVQQQQQQQQQTFPLQARYQEHDMQDEQLQQQQHFTPQAAPLARAKLPPLTVRTTTKP